jgi:hypothetical protein
VVRAGDTRARAMYSLFECPLRCFALSRRLNSIKGLSIFMVDVKRNNTRSQGNVRSIQGMGQLARL